MYATHLTSEEHASSRAAPKAKPPQHIPSRAVRGILQAHVCKRRKQPQTYTPPEQTEASFVGRRIQIGDLDAEEEDGNQLTIGTLRGWHVRSDNDNEDYDCKAYSRGKFSKEKDVGEDEDGWKAISNSGHNQPKHFIDSSCDIEDKSNFDEKDTDKLLLNLHGTIVAQSLHDRDEGLTIIALIANQVSWHLPPFLIPVQSGSFLIGNSMASRDRTRSIYSICLGSFFRMRKT
jgi:hypothetical protein